jgi:DNA gyrase/topoisomerase IV subunit A
VVTITKGGYSKRTKADAYRAQKRGGKGVKGAALKTDDVVEHFFTASTHNWLLFFTIQGAGISGQRFMNYQMPAVMLEDSMLQIY